MDCIFCDIINGKSKSHVVWQDDEHMAFLSIFPNTEGVTVVIPKKHYPSYAFALPEDVLISLVQATKKVAILLDTKFADVGRTAMVFEGFGVDHVHAKLFPLHGTKMDNWKQLSSTNNTYFDIYPGYVSSNDSTRADDETLEMLAKKIRS